MTMSKGWDLNCRSLVSVATTLPTLPQLLQPFTMLRFRFKVFDQSGPFKSRSKEFKSFSPDRIFHLNRFSSQLHLSLARSTLTQK